MKVKYIKELQGASKYGTCIECGKGTDEKEIIAISFEDGRTIHLCENCARRTKQNLGLFLRYIHKGVKNEK